MKRHAAWASALLTTAMLDCGSAHAQARGPSAQDARENGQYVAPDQGVRPPTRVVDGWREVQIGKVAPDVELSALGPAGAFDEADRLAQLAALETWFRRLPGRFRIDGRIEAPGFYTVQVVNGAQSLSTQLKGKVSGVAECAEIGEGVGVQCVLNATWPVIDIQVASVAGNFQPMPQDALNTLQPGMLVMGVNLDPPGVRAVLVTDDSVAHTWAGKLTDSTLTADRLTHCIENNPDAPPWEFRCLQPLQVIAAPDSQIVTIILKMGTKPAPDIPERIISDTDLRPLTITLTMHRDAKAVPEKQMKAKKAR